MLEFFSETDDRVRLILQLVKFSVDCASSFAKATDDTTIRECTFTEWSAF